MNKMKTKYILLMVFGFLLLGCNEDFLIQEPYAVDTDVTFYANFEALDMTATAAYAMLCTRDIFDIQYIIGYGSAASDDAEMGGENTNDWVPFQHVDQMTHTPNEARMYDIWGYCYKGIRMCNDFLYKVDEVKEQDTQTEAALFDQRTAEVKFLRAFYHFTLSQIFGGVPVIIEPLDPTQFSMSRNNIKEVYTQIEQDLTDAIPYLPNKGEDQVGRATKGAARALLGKVLLYESSYAANYAGDYRFGDVTERWSEALGYLEEVIGDANYGLVGDEGERFSSWWDRSADTSGVGGYRWLFSLAADNSEESVWEIQAVQDGKGWVRSRGNYITVYTTCRFYNNTSTPGTDQAYGWSFNLPTSYLLDAFGNQDSRETGLNSAPMAPENDPRFLTTVGQPGDEIYLNDGSDGLGWYPMSFTNLPTGTISRKYECAPDEYWEVRNDWHDGPMNLKMIRLADVYLMAAEAAYMSNDQAKALDYVNSVRTRARLSGDTGYPTDLASISFEDIVHERRLELAMEGHRFYDLVRWGLATKYINGTKLAALGDGFTVSFVEGKHEFFPISTMEIQLTNGGLEQYDAWK